MKCPQCGSDRIVEEGSVFVEDGPWNGRVYLNEGDVTRYLCQPCGCCFGILPDPVRCAGCGERIVGEEGEDYIEHPTQDDAYLCESCMKNPKPDPREMEEEEEDE